MDRVELYEAEFRASHRHRDGSWGEYEPEPAPHDPAALDEERRLATGRVYRCTVCNDKIVVLPAEESANASGQR